MQLELPGLVPQPGDRIQFLRELSCGPCEEHPAYLYADKDGYGTIDRVTRHCWEGYMVFWDHWPQASFGCERKDFLLIEGKDWE